MKLPGKKKDKKNTLAKHPRPATPTPALDPAPAPAQPMMDGLRQDAPAQAVDLSGRAFNDAFPAISERLAERRRQHQRRRELANQTPGNQAVDQPAMAAGVALPTTDEDEDT
jgi:hypothetical protein